MLQVAVGDVVVYPRDDRVFLVLTNVDRNEHHVALCLFQGEPKTVPAGNVDRWHKYGFRDFIRLNGVDE